MTTPRSTLRMLIERLNWPVRLAKWRTAREYGALLSEQRISSDALDIYLSWVSSRQFESEVCSALAILFCTKHDALPPINRVRESIKKPSILADLLLEGVYGEGNLKGQWQDAHSGVAPASFRAERYFLRHKSAQIPPILTSQFERLQKASGYPFMRQWAFEWHNLMESTDSPYSGYPYHFVDAVLRQSKVHGQFSQRQCDVYRSAYLRTLACAVTNWKMPLRRAREWAADSLPLSPGLLALDPIARPEWLSDIPERCAEADDKPLEPLIREMLVHRTSEFRKRAVALSIPISTQIARFADLTILAVLASDDFAPDWDVDQTMLRRALPWVLPDGLTVEGEVKCDEIGAFTTSGKAGVAAPLCLDLWPLPSGFWQNDYFQVGIKVPAPYLFREPISLSCENGGMQLARGRSEVATWNVWHDHWTPLYPEDGATRCGTVTTLAAEEVDAASQLHQMRLGWLVELNTWTSPSDYGELERRTRREFFLE